MPFCRSGIRADRGSVLHDVGPRYEPRQQVAGDWRDDGGRLFDAFEGRTRGDLSLTGVRINEAGAGGQVGRQ